MPLVYTNKNCTSYISCWYDITDDFSCFDKFVNIGPTDYLSIISWTLDLFLNCFTFRFSTFWVFFCFFFWDSTQNITHTFPWPFFSLTVSTTCHLQIFTIRLGPLLLFLAARLFRDEDTYGEVSALCAVLVLHQDAVLARVWRVHGGDGEAGELARLKLEDAVLVGRDLPVVLEPGDLWYGISRNVAGEIESLCGE